MSKFASVGLGGGRHAALLVITFATLVGCQENPAAFGASGWGGGGVGGAAGAAGFSARASIGNTPVPCEIQEALDLGCRSCHAATPIAGAPMALVTLEDFTAPAISNPSVTVAQMVGVRINATDPQQQMPPVPAQNASTFIVKERLNGYLGAGVSAGPVQCGGGGGAGGVGGVGGVAGVGGAGGAGGGGGFGGVAGVGGAGAVGGVGGVGGGGGAGQCYSFPVHANSVAGDTTPFPVNGQFYSAFYYDMPWDGDVQAISFNSKFDARPDTVHHWLVYLDENDNQPNGTVVAQGSGTHPSSPTLVAGWAPGADNNDLPSDVGIKMNTPNRKLLIEVHWFNSGAPHNSTFAVEICTAATPRPNTATISWLGSEQIFLNGGTQATVTGSCAPTSTSGVPYNGDIHILRSWPHMHKLGYRMDSHIIRANGQREQLFDELFSFDRQVSYPTPAVLHPGDRIETRCYYNNNTPGFVGIGYRSEDEMCFNFMTAYPAGALKSVGFLGAPSTLTSSSTGCLF